ncbi:MAG: complex I subunit 1 family protein [Candidatus Marinimicrobia bacterium]|nr:complex I subunit 1 family protein [Candidatus Neomarinimicrobiota bacterium]
MSFDWIKLLGFIVTPLIASAVGFTYMGLSRKVTARVQNRIGPGVSQSFIDVVKLYSKKTAIHHGVMQHMGPVFAITASVTTLFFIPILKDSIFFANFSFRGDLIFLMYIMVFGQLGMALGAGQTGNPNSAIGVSRGLSQMVGYKVPYVLALIAIMVNFETTNLQELIAVQDGFRNWMIFQMPVASLAGMLAFLGFMMYAPFDVPFAPSEIASGPPSEFGGKYLALMMTSRSIFTFVKLVLFVDLFFGGASSFIELLIKTFVLYLFALFVGLVNPRFRTEQSIQFWWKWPAAIGILAVLLVAWKG